MPADFFSRFPLGEVDLPFHDIVSFIHINNIAKIPVTAETIARRSQLDPVISKVISYVLHGWPQEWQQLKHVPEAFRSFFLQRNNFTNVRQCLVIGSRVVIPTCLRPLVLSELHGAHQGVVKMKMIARRFVWWPSLNSDIEKLCQQCIKCNEFQRMAPATQIHPNPWPAKPWEVLHTDLEGPFLNCNFLILIDAHSRWVEVKQLKKTDAAHVISKLKSIFVQNGIPKIIVSDNGPQFIAGEFSDFCRQNAIVHRTVSPYHARSNGLAERVIQTFKNFMLKTQHEGTVKDRIRQFLLQYRVTPHSFTDQAPSEMLMGRLLRTRINATHPEDTKTLKAQQKSAESGSSIDRDFVIGEPVWIVDFRRTGKAPLWLQGIVTKVVAPCTYEITCGTSIFTRHVDHIRKCFPLNPKNTPIFGQGSQDLDMAAGYDNLGTQHTLVNTRIPRTALENTNLDLGSYTNMSCVPEHFASYPTSMMSSSQPPRHPPLQHVVATQPPHCRTPRGNLHQSRVQRGDVQHSRVQRGDLQQCPPGALVQQRDDNEQARPRSPQMSDSQELFAQQARHAINESNIRQHAQQQLSTNQLRQQAIDKQQLPIVDRPLVSHRDGFHHTDQLLDHSQIQPNSQQQHDVRHHVHQSVGLPNSDSYHHNLANASRFIRQPKDPAVQQHDHRHVSQQADTQEDCCVQTYTVYVSVTTLSVMRHGIDTRETDIKDVTCQSGF
jgi:transposase InsO family protein